MRLTSVKCPNCGAGLDLAPDAEVVSCRYCHRSSYVARPHPKTQQFEIPPQYADFAVIRVTEGARAAMSMVLWISLLVAGCAIAGAMFVAYSIRSATRQALGQLPLGGIPRNAVVPYGSRASVGPVDPTCARAGACCRALGALTGGDMQRSCADIERSNVPAMCTSVYTQMRSTVAQLGGHCD
jgi:ribosomal protein S27AE